MSLEADVRKLVIEGERVLHETHNRANQKEALQPQYRLYLNVLIRSKLPNVPRAEDYLRIIRAMRDEEAVANLESVPEDDAIALERLVGSPLRVLSAYLERLPRTIVLVIETGAESLTFFALRSGSAPLEDRIALQRANKEFLHLAADLMRQQTLDIERIANREPITPEFSIPIQKAAEAAWLAMPEAIRSAINSAATILYLPSPFGDLSTFPLELLRGADGWLGATRAIARLSSMRTLFELLSPNRMPSKLEGKALIVRAEDSDELTGADTEIDSVQLKLTALRLKVKVEKRPRVKTMRTALDGGMRALHYCGHGFAGRLGESLPLAVGEVLGPQDFSQLSGSGTPFVYLSTCEVGRARMTMTGNGAGISTRLIEKGAPAVVACLQRVPDVVARDTATSFYDAVASRPVGAALTKARSDVGRYPPACWGAFVLFGDPNLELRGFGWIAAQTREMTRAWDSFVGRHLAIRSPQSRQKALDALAEARAEPNADSKTLDQVTGWLEGSFGPTEPDMREPRLELCRAVTLADVVAGCTLRMLLAMETLHGSYYGKRKPDLVFSEEEVAIGLHCAHAVHDTIAWPAFVIECARSGGIGYEPTVLARMLDEAIGRLAGWQLEEPAAAEMLSYAQDLRQDHTRLHKR